MTWIVGWAKAPAVPIAGLASRPMGTRCFAHPTRLLRIRYTSPETIMI